MNPNSYWKALRKSWIVIVALVIVGGLVGLAYASSLPDSYSSKSGLFVSSSDGGSALGQGSTFTQNAVQSYADLATTPAVLNPVISSLGLDTTPTKLARQISAQTPLNTVFVNITVTDPSPQQAADISNAVARSLTIVATDLAPTTSGKPAVTISIVAPAAVPQNPTGPNRHLIEITAAIIGLAVGVLYAIGRALGDTRVRTTDDIDELTEIAVAGTVRRGTLGHLAVRDEPSSAMAEDYRRLAATLRFAGAGGAVRSVTLTSATHGVSDADAALDLALAVGERRQRVLVIDADLRAPSLAPLARVEAPAGLTEVLDTSSPVALTEAVASWTGYVDILAAGTAVSNPHFALGSPALGAVITEASAAYDLVIVHAAPVVDFADAITLSHLTEGTLVTARAGATARKHLAASLESLLGARATVTGIVLTAARSVTPGAKVAAVEPAPAVAAAPAGVAPAEASADTAEADESAPSGTSSTGSSGRGTGRTTTKG